MAYQNLGDCVLISGFYGPKLNFPIITNATDKCLYVSEHFSRDLIFMLRCLMTKPFIASQKFDPDLVCKVTRIIGIFYILNY